MEAGQARLKVVRQLGDFTKREETDEHLLRVQVEERGQMVDIYHGRSSRPQCLISQGKHPSQQDLRFQKGKDAVIASKG